MGSYPCGSRCVRRADLCGLDAYTGKDDSHRKGWLRDRLKELVAVMAVDVLDYAVLDNFMASATAPRRSREAGHPVWKISSDTRPLEHSRHHRLIVRPAGQPQE